MPFYIFYLGRFIRIDPADILFALSDNHHIRLHTTHGVYLPHLSLKELEPHLPAADFCRVNRGTLVNLSRVQAYDKESVYLGERVFSFSDFFKRVFEGKVTVVIHREQKAMVVRGNR